MIIYEMQNTWNRMEILVMEIHLIMGTMNVIIVINFLLDL